MASARVAISKPSLNMLRVLLAGVLATVVVGDCPYAGIKGNVLVADATCGKNLTICGVNSTCDVTINSINASIPTYTGWSAVGNLDLYPLETLTIKNSASVTIRKMSLPLKLQTLIFKNVTSVDLTSTTDTKWDSLSVLQFLECPGVSFSNTMKWPSKLDLVILRNNALSNIPQFLPSTLTALAIQGNTLVDLTYLPKSNLTLLNLDTNYIKSITDHDWRSLDFLRLSNNTRLETIANVQLSTKLTYFDVGNCSSLQNFTVDASTFSALNALKPWAGNTSELTGFVTNYAIATDATACTGNGGTIQSLWKDTAKLPVSVCVTTVKAASTTAPPTTSSSNTGLIVGIIVGVVVIAAAVGFFIYRRRKHAAPEPSIYHRYEPPTFFNDNNTAGTNGTGVYTNKSIGTNGTGGQTIGTGPTNGTSGSRGALQYTDADVVLNVKPLLHHRLELSDLYVTSNKPLASGAFGEVWLGTYGGKQVAIKRMKNQEARMVQKFIDEIVLMSQMDSDYIVKFVGASWTRPIEIECVVEYMDLGDLRSYLVNQSPAQFSWDQKLNCITSIVRGLVYLHTYKPPIIHRDMKSRNVLLDSVKGTKLTDFGASRVAEEDDLMTNGIGTYQWMAPEVISGTNYGAPADIYSFGIILSEFATHQVPYADKRHPETGKALPQHYVLNHVREGKMHPTFNGPGVPSWVQDIGLQCLQLHEDDRPTALMLSALLSRCKP
ncbi:TKL protein kinase [Saprolegnia diclina VS20]|uniref:TKL protein kinase n=1 Tax=Saprolegnia diclina (strain VS20) TaxID=1156394 RepID=T0RAJ4_SAPDV|nr:TKL protein kinase [Saprolegnia diclina VS20]EQC29203.1 TKL protein kinase [Saprolegnia diclina VS20]|eukprot:XP_008617381.1 TKL protein kinase [Saprolegnia diclina VS20]